MYGSLKRGLATEDIPYMNVNDFAAVELPETPVSM